MALETSILANLKKEAIRNGHPPDEKLIQKQLQQKLQHALNNLPEWQKQVYIMSRIQGMKQQEIANQLNISISTVQNHMTEALKKLKQIFGKDYVLIAIFILGIQS